MENAKGKLGILVGGGPAPGINSAISAATIEAVNRGLEVVGIYDGFAGLIDGRPEKVRELSISDVSRIHNQGGSILRTSRANPTRNPDDLRQCVANLKYQGIAYLVSIGGDDTAFSAYAVARAAEGAICVVHVPKTIDNDLPLPSNMPTFGHETARHVGTDIVMNLMEESRTTNRWFFVVAMGRKAGHLALGIGKAAGATLTVIPEEFPQEQISLSDVCNVLEGSILKRQVMGRQDGLVVIAEGILEKLDPTELAGIIGAGTERDPHDHLRLGDIPLGMVLRREIQHRFSTRGHHMPIVDVMIGYSLRCAPPIPFDIDYTRDLGHGAVRFLTDGSLGKKTRLQYGGMICLEDGDLHIIPFEEFTDQKTGRTRIRQVDNNAEHYRVARQYMIRLQQSDFDDPEMLGKLAEAAKITPDEFKKTFSSAVDVSTH